MRRRPLLLGASFVVAVAAACSRPPTQDAAPPMSTVTGSSTGATDASTAPALAFDASRDASFDAANDAGDPLDGVSDDPKALEHTTREDLLTLFPVRPLTDQERARVRPDLFLNQNVGDAPSRMNQGNARVAQHAIGKRTCLRGLAGITLQTDAQRERCKGMRNMVPIWTKGGDESHAHTCIDVFEFPNEPCELPIVWSAPTFAATVCALQGKRLCTQDEWSLACRGDPEGGPDRKYAYGDEMDLSICNTNKSRPDPSDPKAVAEAHARGEILCDGRQVKTAWETCGTNTEPTGAYPKCRSRFGVFDQHGNVAEIMTRKTEDGQVVSQLKGSAFFYVDVARRPGEPQKPGARETYPDQCNFDPRWHVEPMEAAWHVNYHLGFRCCLSL